MKRVMVIGSGGAGKSRFSRRLGEVTGLPVIHLDTVFWRPGWRETPRDEWESIVERLTRADRWIMDGNYGGTRAIRLKAADTVIFLDVPRLTCLYRVVRRAIAYRGRSRPDMAEGCSEKLDLEFLSWIWNFPARSRAKLHSDAAKHPEKRFVVLRTKREAEQFIEQARACE